MTKFPDRPADHLAGLVSEQLQHDRVHAADDPAGVELVHADAGRWTLEHLLVTARAVPRGLGQLVLIGLQAGDHLVLGQGRHGNRQRPYAVNGTPSTNRGAE
jgi:hypothetical protein